MHSQVLQAVFLMTSGLIASSAAADHPVRKKSGDVIEIEGRLHAQHKRAIGSVIGVSPDGFLLFEGRQYRVVLWGIKNIQPEALDDLIGVELICSEFGPEPDELSISAGCNLLAPVGSGVWYSSDGVDSVQQLLIRRNMAVESCDISDNTFRSCTVKEE